MARADGFAFRLAALLEFKRRLELALDVIRAPQRHFGFFHQLEEGRLHAATADVAANHVGGGSELVDFVDVDDAELRERDIAVGFLHELPHEIFHVAADVAGLAKFRRVRFDERHLDQIRDVFDQVGFSDAGRADEDDVLFRVFGFLGADGVFAFEPAEVIDVVVVIADRDGEDLLGFVLLDHETIEMRLDVAREKIENELAAARFGGLLFVAGLGALGLGEGREGNFVTEVRFHELGELGLEFFRCGKGRILIHATKRAARKDALANLTSSSAM